MAGVMGHVPVGYKTLQPADGYRLALDAPHAVFFALAFLGLVFLLSVFNAI